MLDPITIDDHFAEQAAWCAELGSPFTADLLKCFAEDFKQGGPVRTLCADWPGNPRKDALGLRLAGALHHAVLGSPDGRLSAAYPQHNPNGKMAEIWPVARTWLCDHSDEVKDFIQHPPQTNEPQRSLILLPGFLDIAARYGQALHLLELGASAGLNQNWSQFSYKTDQWQRLASSKVLISGQWSGPRPAHLDQQVEIASQAGCDLNPVNVSDPAALQRLKAYIGPDQPERMSRLEAAVELAQANQIRIERAQATDWLKGRLANRPRTGVTVIFHSVFLIYPPADQIAAIKRLIIEAGEQAIAEAPLAWLCFESEGLFGGRKDTQKMQARLQTWPGGDVRTYAEADGHVRQVHMF